MPRRRGTRCGTSSIPQRTALLELPRGDRIGVQAFCGSLLYSVVRDGGWVHVALGSLGDEPSIRPNEHIFVGSKAVWFETTDDLPQNEEY